MKHEEFFRKHPVFTGEEFKKYLSDQGDIGSRMQESLLAYYSNAGRIVRVRRGLYTVVPKGADPGSYPVDPYLVASRLTPDAVLSHHTALEFFGRSYSSRTYFTYSASRPLRTFSFRSHVFRGTKFPKALLSAGKEYFGVSAEEISWLEVRVTCLERTMVDVLDRPDLSGSWEEIWRSLESIEFFDLDRVVQYALLLGNATTGAKVGFFLEQHRESLMVEDHHLEALHDLRPKQPHYLDRSERKSGRLISRWNLMVPEEVLERTWGEVL